MEEMARCPKCDGEIIAGARKCKHCGEFLDESLKQEQAPRYQQRTGPPPSNGAAIAALVLGIIGLFFQCLSVIAIILGFVGLAKAKKHPSRPGQGAAIAGLILGFVGLLLLVVVIAAIAIPNLLAAKTAANEIRAAATLRQIMSVQEQHRMRFNEYADLQKLAEAGDIDPGVAAAVDSGSAKSGYYFICEADANYYSCIAMPAIPGTTGNRSFYISVEGFIRVAPCRSAGDPPADENSPPFDY